MSETTVDNAVLNFEVLCEEPCMQNPPCGIFKGEDEFEVKLAILLCLIVDENCRFKYEFTVSSSDTRVAVMEFTKYGNKTSGRSKEIQKL